MRYYIQDTRSYLGDAVMWWRPNGEGYTSDIDDAGEYEEAEAVRICRSRSTEKAIPVDVARAAIVRVVYAGHLHRAMEAREIAVNAPTGGGQ